MTKIIAHRGSYGPSGTENTLESFDKAIKLGVDMVEFDVRRTHDGEMVVFHDKKMKDMVIEKTDYAVLEETAQASGFHLPLFAEVLMLCHKRVFMDIEIKEHGFEKQVVDALHELADISEYSVKSFDDNVPYTIKKLDKNITVGLLLGCHDSDFKKRINEVFPWRRVKACKADFVSPYYLLIQFGFLARMRRAHIPVYVWTVNEKKRIGYYMLKNIDGIITDRPDIAMELREKRIFKLLSK